MEDNSFKQILKTYEKPVYNYLYLMIQEKEITEELTEETFIKVRKNIKNFSENGKLSVWVYQIATNTFLDYFNLTDQNIELKTTQLIEEMLGKMYFGDAEKLLSIDECLTKSEMIDCVRRFIDELPADCRAVIILHDLHGFKIKEISEILNYPIGSIKSRLLHARERFRFFLAEYQDLCHESYRVK